ncbi:aminoacyl-tRNA hydrolase [Thiorhodovibrio frisius]|uniref:Peptidyl-tRNA hydrolase n=1 Tax=Thiorhodovibrio frisius TaxID=631362 RepID=H8Z2X5_9GAMM|nr:aminoacyl-tRNA hydrolase [Thiorhodovibrio frisius]EIC21711.1 peptidyl-tRNA hydrolase [Thiorhodovibrio frisius]WPL21679.1 Peptidyl-tRNA hydrolase [Thiorhodovibrio frisius]
MSSDQGISLIVGLGNPGRDYEGTRHNAGFCFVERLAAEHGGRFHPEAKFFGELCRLQVHGHDLRLVKPTTFMNHSGRSIAAVARYFDIPPANILVAYDELDLPPGQLKLKFGGGHAGHNGMRDTLAALANHDFWRLRIGIGHPGHKEQVVGYVLSHPSRADLDAILGAVDQAEDCLPELLAGEFQRAMNRLHARS